MTTEDCQICFDTFNGSTRKRCACPYCAVGYCRECVGTWLTNLVDEPRCPNDTCKKAWSREYLDTIVTKVWRDSTYREYREKLLLDRERALLPATQPRIEAINEAKRIDTEIIVPMRNRRKMIVAEMRKLDLESQGIQTQIWDLTNRAERLRAGVGVDEAAAKNRSVFIRRCPSEGCRGFLSSAWKCGTCDLYSCADCQEVKGVARDSPHTCDPGALETAKLIAKDTKGCPKCGEMITKIDGCDQMWCVSCHTAFSWRTGQVASGVVHNPHFYEWQRKVNNGVAPRNIGDMPCGGILDWGTLRSVLLPRGAAYPGWLQNLEVAHRRINHVQNIDLPRLAQAAVNINDNIDLRIQYLLKDINDNEMMVTLQAREKKREKEIEIRRVYETLTGAANDIFRRLHTCAIEKGTAPTNFTPFLIELDELRKFINEALDVLRRRYSCTLHGFSPSWDSLTLRKTTVKEDTNKEIKTLYGTFNDELTKFEELFTKLRQIEPTEDGMEVTKPLGNSLRKLQKIVRDFPTNTAASGTTRLANSVLAYYDNAIRVIWLSNGTRKNDYERLHYERARDRYRDEKFLWKEHAKTLDLVIAKPANTIE